MGAVHRAGHEGHKEEVPCGQRKGTHVFLHDVASTIHFPLLRLLIFASDSNGKVALRCVCVAAPLLVCASAEVISAIAQCRPMYFYVSVIFPLGWESLDMSRWAVARLQCE